MPPIRVLVVDDSALVRKTVRAIIDADRGLEVAGVAVNGEDALAQAAKLRPDVVTLDLKMPVMDGMTCLSQLIREYRQPVVILSTLARENAFPTFKALALGAVDFVTKPGVGKYLATVEDLAGELREKIRTAARVPREKIGRRPSRARTEPPSRRPRPAPAVSPRLRTVAGIGGSTGATVALESLLRRLPADLPAALVIVQHLPRGFEQHLTRYLDSVAELAVKVARDREPLVPGTAYLAAGGEHLRVRRGAGGLHFRTDTATAAQRGFRPSINVLFYSLALAQRRRALAILLSGMGDDGVQGLRAVHRLGGGTAVQDRDSSVVYGMAARAVEAGAVDQVLPVEGLSAALIAALHGGPARARRRGPKPTVIEHRR
ncbi:MAG: chemotaxis-specific protein-glutamate methyltransferase CheB [bacterium]|nr:chemotaxis-specific protein-glutamate methyltransferase CheB [bacterium]